MVFLYEFEGGELMVIESVSPSQLFVCLWIPDYYNCQEYNGAKWANLSTLFSWFPFTAPLLIRVNSPKHTPLTWPILLSRKSVCWRENIRYCCCFPPTPVLICCSLMLPSHLSHQASGEYSQRMAATHAQCGKVAHGGARPDSPRSRRSLTEAKLKVEFNHGEEGKKIKER